MERKRNPKNEDRLGQRRHRPLDTYELYELEHMPYTLKTKVPSIDRAKTREDATSRPHYEPGRKVQDSWSQTKDGNHGQQRHRPRDAYQLYELEHMPRTLPQVNVPSNDRAKPRDQYEAFRPQTVQKSWSQRKDGSGESHKENINYAAEAFIKLEHEKFELSNWMSMNGC
ncbi:UNVERIFIED_CONTAM: hypothetical protein Sindi_0162300 [Sesamum indicum]